MPKLILNLQSNIHTYMYVCRYLKKVAKVLLLKGCVSALIFFEFKRKKKEKYCNKICKYH